MAGKSGRATAKAHRVAGSEAMRLEALHLPQYSGRGVPGRSFAGR